MSDSTGVVFKVQECPNCGATYAVPGVSGYVDEIEIECRCGTMNRYALDGSPLVE